MGLLSGRGHGPYYRHGLLCGEFGECMYGHSRERANRSQYRPISPGPGAQEVRYLGSITPDFSLLRCAQCYGPSLGHKILLRMIGVITTRGAWVEVWIKLDESLRCPLGSKPNNSLGS